MDVWAMYEALPPDKKREFDRVYQQASEVAEGMQAKTRRLEALCDAMEDAEAEERAVIHGGPRHHQAPAQQYA